MSELHQIVGEASPVNNERMFDATSPWYRQEHWFDSSLRSPYVYDITHKRLLEALALTGQEEVFEMGCGPGTWTRVIASGARHVTVVELSQRMLERAREYVHRLDVEFIHSDILRYKPTRTYDRVVSLRAIEYIQDQQALIGRLTSMVADDGLLVIVSKTPISAWRGRRVLGKLRRVFTRPKPSATHRTHEDPASADASNYFMQRVSPWRLARAIRAAGFDDVSIRPVIVGLPILMGAHDEGSDLPLIPRFLAPVVLLGFNWLGNRLASAPQWAMPLVLPLSESYIVRGHKAAEAAHVGVASRAKRFVAVTLTVLALAFGGYLIAKSLPGAR